MPGGNWLVIELDLDISPTNTFMKFGGKWMRNIQVRERTKLKWPILTNSGGHNSGVPKGIWLVIKLDRDILPTNTFMKFGGNWMRNVQVRERTKLKWPI